MKENNMTWSCALADIKKNKLYDKDTQAGGNFMTGGRVYHDFIKKKMVDENITWNDAQCKEQSEKLYIDKHTTEQQKLDASALKIMNRMIREYNKAVENDDETKIKFIKLKMNRGNKKFKELFKKTNKKIYDVLIFSNK